MKRFAFAAALCLLAAGVAIGAQAWHWRERKIQEDARGREQSAAENEVAGRLGLKAPPLPPHPFDRRAAIDEALRLEPDRRFLLAARELAGADVAARFSERRWILSVGEREFARVAELPDFPELMKALAPLAQQWVSGAKVTGKAPRIRALRSHKEAFAAIREAQTRWSKGDRTAAILHDAASAAAALMLQLPRAFDADDRLDAHALALSAADAAAGADVRAEQAVLALALGYAGAARTLAPAEEEPALHAFVTLDRRKLADLVRRKEATAGHRYLLLRWLMEDANEEGVLRFMGAARDNEHISIPMVGELLLDADLQFLASASDALPALAIAELENVRVTAPTDTELLKVLNSARNSALQTLANNEDPRSRLAADLRQADSGYDGPLWRGADTSAWYAAAIAAALLGSARSGYVLRPDASGLAEELGSWPVPVAAQVARWVKARTSAERGNLEELYEALGTGKLPGPRATADLLDAMGRQLESPDPRMVDLVRIARRHFDSRPASRLVWAEVLRIHERDLERSAALVGSMVDAGAGAYPLDEVVLARQRGRIDRLDQIAGDERLPFPARLEAAGALADRGAKAQAEKALRRLARERPRDVATHERLIRFLNDGGRPDALAAAVELVRAFGEDDSFDVARARCAAARQLDGMGRHEEALAMVERALPTEAACAYRIATVQLAHLGKKDDAEGLLLADLARHPLASTAVTMAEVRWRSHNDAGAADIVAHPPAPLERGDFRELAQRFADVFRNRPPGDVKHAAETLLQAGIHPQPLLALGPPLARTGAHAQAFELYAVLIPKLPAEKIAWAQLHAWSALRAAKGAPAAEAWLRKQAGPEATPVSDDDLAMVAYGDGLDEALWDLFPAKPLDAAFADHLALLRAASLVRHGERSARRDALVAELSDPLSRWKAHLARSLGLAGAYASWEVRLARFVLGEGSEEEIADDATEGSRPCEAPYYFGVRAASESRAPEAAAWYRVALECRNPDQAEFAWAYRAASQIGQEQAPPANLPQAAR